MSNENEPKRSAPQEGGGVTPPPTVEEIKEKGKEMTKYKPWHDDAKENARIDKGLREAVGLAPASPDTTKDYEKARQKFIEASKKSEIEEAGDRLVAACNWSQQEMSQWKQIANNNYMKAARESRLDSTINEHVASIKNMLSEELNGADLQEVMSHFQRKLESKYVNGQPLVDAYVYAELSLQKITKITSGESPNRRDMMVRLSGDKERNSILLKSMLEQGVV